MRGRHCTDVDPRSFRSVGLCHLHSVLCSADNRYIPLRWREYTLYDAFPFPSLFYDFWIRKRPSPLRHCTLPIPSATDRQNLQSTLERSLLSYATCERSNANIKNTCLLKKSKPQADLTSLSPFPMRCSVRLPPTTSGNFDVRTPDPHGEVIRTSAKLLENKKSMTQYAKDADMHVG
jgi:hypothetical protein